MVNFLEVSFQFRQRALKVINFWG